MPDPPPLSGRAPWEATENRLAITRRRLAGDGVPILDLTVSNPTAVGLDLPLDALADALRAGASAPYAPHPFGLPAAREALAVALSTPGDRVDPSDLVLTASTSEAYAMLFKVLCDPGEQILTHSPTYPLLDHLAMLESVELRHFPLEFEAGSRRPWTIGADRLQAAITPATRGIVAIHPNNPTGHFLSVEEHDLLADVARGGVALISDEVFGDYALRPPVSRAGVLAAREDIVAISLGGLSKSAGLPHWKLGWMRVGGPPAARRRLLAAIELVADAWLSVAAPVQAALPSILALAPGIRKTILDRLVRNLSSLEATVVRHPEIEVLPVEGGWSAVIRTPRLSDDETLAVELLEREHVAVHPGYFFDFQHEGFIVISLLPEPGVFDEATQRLVTNVTARRASSVG